VVPLNDAEVLYVRRLLGTRQIESEPLHKLAARLLASQLDVLKMHTVRLLPVVIKDVSSSRLVIFAVHHPVHRVKCVHYLPLELAKRVMHDRLVFYYRHHKRL
jgi:predicted cation transporter